MISTKFSPGIKVLVKDKDKDKAKAFTYALNYQLEQPATFALKRSKHSITPIVVMVVGV